LFRIYMSDLDICWYVNANSPFNVVIKILSLDSIERSIYDYIYCTAHFIFAYDSIEQLLAEIIVHYLRFISKILVNLMFSQ